MFFLRSAFWLVIGFLLVAPHGTDFGATATSLKDQAISASVSAGEQIIMSQITQTARLPDILLASHATLEHRAAPPAGPTVFPRPRPAALG